DERSCRRHGGLPLAFHPSRRQFAAGLAGLALGEMLSPLRPFAQTRRPGRIDFHCHSAPPAWKEFLKATGGGGGVSWTVSQHLEDMDRAGVATSLLSIASPGIWHGRDLTAIRTVARKINEF